MDAVHINWPMGRVIPTTCATHIDIHTFNKCIFFMLDLLHISGDLVNWFDLSIAASTSLPQSAEHGSATALAGQCCAVSCA